MTDTIKNDVHETFTQESLQPQRITPDDKAYQGVRDIEERLRLGDATNIAITGPYGSGKSSILLSLKTDYPNYHYLNISLATLQPMIEKPIDSDEEQNNQEDGEISKENLDRLIEYSILQQLVYREKQDTLPNSRLKRIFQLSSEKIRNRTCAILGMLAALIILFEPSFLHVEWICELLGHKWLNIIGDALSIVYLIWFAYKSLQIIIVPAISNSRLNKLNLKNGEIEIVKNTSIFNKHLDEILYFFEKTEYNVVILEDLDRFESTAIFLKLRELNLLLNESQVIGRKIVFIYAVRDDMFQDADRVKCFDYITTVIPVINRSNAKNQLKAELKKRGVTEINEKCLSELGFFLYDMRLLKNIANEYVQYRVKLEKGISPEKLLAMIVYKNFYPRDFALLHDCKGTVYQLINLKDIFIAKETDQLEKESAEKQEQLTKHLKEKHLKESELRQIYVDAYRERIGNTMQGLKVGDAFYSVKEIVNNEDLFEKLISNPIVTYSFVVNNGQYSVRQQTKNMNIPFSQIENDVDSGNPFHKRMNSLRLTFKDLDEATNIEKRKDINRSQTISQIMNRVDYRSIRDYTELNVPKLIEYLVVNGYIDENYYDYISYFYDNFIDVHDWNFILDLKLGREHRYEFHVNNVEACLAEIPFSVYQKKAILNIDIVDYLVCDRQKNHDKLKIKNKTTRTKFAEKIRENDEKLSVILRTVVEGEHYDFLSTYYRKGSYQGYVFSFLFSLYKNLWLQFEGHDNDKHELKLIWFKYAEIKLNCFESRKWLSQHYDFITKNLLDVDSKQWCRLINEVYYEFEELNKDADDILNEVVSRNAYVLNKKNVELLISYFLNMDCDSASYRLVLETKNKELIEYVEKNLRGCLSDVFAAPESENENEAAILGILTSNNVSEEQKISYLSKQQNAIGFHNIEGNDLKTLAIKCDVIEPTWENIIHYMNNVSENRANSVLLEYVERHCHELSLLVVPTESVEDGKMLLGQFIASDLLLYDAFEKILNSFSHWYYSNGVPTIKERRVKLLIAKGMIRFTEKNTESILNNYSVEAAVFYLIKNKRDYLAASNSISYSTELALGVMKSDLTARELVTIIPHFTVDILNEELADEIILVLNQQEMNLDIDFLLRVLSLTSKADEKLKVLNNTLEKNVFDENTITSLLNTLNYPYKYIAEKGKKPELPNNDGARRLVNNLKNCDYISSCSETKNGIRVNTKLK